MKVKYLIFGSIAFYSYFARSQDAASTREEGKISKTEIEILYSHYIQDGDHSAVTGGTGTEKLTVYSPAIYLKKSSGRNAYMVKGGVDVISSASTDNIDYVVSSASRRDARGYLQLDYSRAFSGNRLVLGGGAGLSFESDYFSKALRLSAEYTPTERMWTWFMNVQLFFDDLRWGRHKGTLMLIYPSELRGTEWFDVYTRNTYAINTGATQIVGRRNVLGLFLDLSYQSGLLSTPFHRVYFNNDSLVVENLPMSRKRGAIGLKWNSFIGGRFILKNRLDFYRDDFGINGFGFTNEILVKLSSRLSLGPHFRFYNQEGSRYFAPYREHSADEPYYTSDYDLSGFRSFLAGLDSRYNLNRYAGKKLLFNFVSLRYSYYHRSDKLMAHIFSLTLNGGLDKSRHEPGE